jgi:1,4-dihydroxy-2-naphthoate octaprenyltransferase
MNFAMWRKALQVIPRITKEEWDRLDELSKWLIASRAAVLVMTFISASIAGIFALQSREFNLWLWLLVTIGLILAHATNNLVNDYVDYIKGVDIDNYYRAQYGPHPLEHGLLSQTGLLIYTVVTGLLALSAGGALVLLRGNSTLILLGLGAFFVLFYTFPLKYFALGELAVLIVWGPLMIGGGYYVITGSWVWNVVLGSLPYALGVTTVIFGKHIDKIEVDKDKGIHTLPVLLGERLSRYTVVGMMVLQYALVFYLAIVGFFTPIILVILFAMPTFFKIIWPMYRNRKPTERPEEYPSYAWPLWFVASAFQYNRRFGTLFLIGLLMDTIWKTLIS